jgi:CheY-like chemotaxis protein
MASLGTLAAGVAHEINNPLASVLANLALAHPEVEALSAAFPIPQDLRDEIREASEAAERIRIIVCDLKLFSREGSDRMGPVDVEQVLESTLRMATNDLRHRALVVKEYGDVPPVRANESRLAQVFLNLVMNAAQAIPAGHVQRNVIRLETYVDVERKQVTVAVSDTGQGMTEAVRKKLFRPFVTTKPAGEGTGLGLSICKRIITDLQGTIDFVSELGKGTTFFVRLPLAEASVAPVVSNVALPTAAPRSTILVVDDEEAIGRTLRRMLSRDHDVSVSRRADEALALIRAGRRFDLILCDLMMPEVSGAELYEELKRIDGAQTERLVFMTGGAFTPATQAFLAGVTARRIEKPFTRDTLEALVAEITT